jgi:hypothetical protein
MNLGWLQVDSPLDEAEAVVLHEFGHVLGLIGSKLVRRGISYRCNRGHVFYIEPQDAAGQAS